MRVPVRSVAGFAVLVSAVIVTFASGSCAVMAEGVNNLVTLQGIKSATVAPNGLAFASLGLTTRRDSEGSFFDQADGSVALGFGLGDASETVGVQFTANVTSLTDQFGDSGHFSIKLSRQINGLDIPTFASLSLDRLGAWGDGTLLDEAATVSLTMFPVAAIGGKNYPLMVTAGYGSGVVEHSREPGAFAGVGIGLTENFGASIAWTGESVALGSSFKFEALDNIRFSATLTDAFDQIGGQGISVSATYYFSDAFGG